MDIKEEKDENSTYTNNGFHESLNFCRLHHFQAPQGIIEVLPGFVTRGVLLQSFNAVI